MSKEILLVVDAVSNEKGISKDVIFSALEAALASAARKLSEEERDALAQADQWQRGNQIDLDSGISGRQAKGCRAAKDRAGSRRWGGRGC